MKALFFTLLFFGGLFLGYDYFIAAPGTKVVFKSLNVLPPKHEDGPVFKSAPQESTEPTAPVAATPAPEAPKPAPAAPPPTAPVATAPVAERNGFTPPKFDPIEMLTANWTHVPASAFPRAVHLTKDIEFRMSVGASKMPAGGSVIALAFDNGNVTLSPTEASSARATVPLDSTDLKPLLISVYEAWKPQRTEELRVLYARKLANQKLRGNATAAEGSLDAAGKPVRSADGSFAILLASIASEQVTEVKKANVHTWGDPTPAKIDGKDGWSIKVNYDANTIFGPMPVEAQALVVNGRVKGWYYIGSGEEVP